MPRYFFHLHNDVETYDDEGIDLLDLAAARVEAIKGARSVMGEEIVKNGRIHLSHWVQVEDANGQQVLAVPFRDCVEVSL